MGSIYSNYIKTDCLYNLVSLNKLSLLLMVKQDFHGRSPFSWSGYISGYLLPVSGTPLSPQGAVRELDDEVWALLSNFSNGQAGSPPFFPSYKSSSFPPYSSPYTSRVSTSSSSSSHSRWSLRNPSPPPPPSGIASVRPTRPQPYSPGHAPHLQVHSVRDCKRFRLFFSSLLLMSCISFWGLVLPWISRARTQWARRIVRLVGPAR